MDCSKPGSSVFHCLLEFAQIHVDWVSDAISLHFTFNNRYIKNWELFLLWLSCLILTGALSDCPLFFPSSLLNTFQPQFSSVAQSCLFVTPWTEVYQGFSLSSLIFIKRLFSSSLLSAIRVVPSAYLRLLIFLPAISIPACASSSLAFPVMYSAYR